MKRLMMACLLAVSSQGWTADLDPECYTLYDMFTRLDSRATIARSNIASEMHDRQCWPALQGATYTQRDTQPQPLISTCNDLVPHIIRLVDEQSDLKILKVYDAKPMTYDTIDKVAGGHDIIRTVTDNKGRSARFRQRLKHGDMPYHVGKQHYTIPGAGTGTYNEDGHYVIHGNIYDDKGVVLVPNSEPFAASPLAGTQRILDCSGEARYADDTWLVQMYMDRDADGEDFIGIAGLMELR